MEFAYSHEVGLAVETIGPVEETHGPRVAVGVGPRVGFGKHEGGEGDEDGREPDHRDHGQHGPRPHARLQRVDDRDVPET